MTTFREAEDVYLYGGGIQMQEEIPCARCGDDVGEDAIEIDGEWYCDNCRKMLVRAYTRDLHRRLSDYTKESDPLKCRCIKEALEDYAEEFEE